MRNAMGMHPRISQMRSLPLALSRLFLEFGSPPHPQRLGVRCIYAFLIASILSSCNVARYHNRTCVKRLHREGFAPDTFTAPDGPHFVWYRDTGKEKILLLHGYTGNGRLQWHRTAQLLANDYDAILPDLLCHGNSTTHWREDTTAFPGTSMDAQVAHVVLLLDSLGVVQPITVVGNSYGGGVAAYLAEQHPHRVKKLVIYDGLVSDYTQAIADSVARAAGSTGMLAAMSTPTYKDLRVGVRLALYRPPPILPGFILRQIFEENVRPFRKAQITLIKDLMANEARFAWHRYTWPMPVYVIWGERDRLIPNSVGRAMMRRNELPADHLIVIPHTGHVPNIERAKRFDRALREVLGK